MLLPQSSKQPTDKSEDASASITQNAEAVAQLDRLYEQPEIARRLEKLRERAFEVLEHNVTNLVKKLGEDEAAEKRAQLLQNVSTRLLTTIARQSSSKVAARRQFARDILICGLINEDNSDWNMKDARTYCTEVDDMLVLLMQRPAVHRT